ncbi:hypothetical protein P8452_78072 [Trifolium repens]|nr:hypothetical protein P8452_78072 [Trifolium repens]
MGVNIFQYHNDSQDGQYLGHRACYFVDFLLDNYDMEHKDIIVKGVSRLFDCLKAKYCQGSKWCNFCKNYVSKNTYNTIYHKS